MHRYRASRRWTLGREALQAFADVMHDRIEPVQEEDIILADAGRCPLWRQFARSRPRRGDATRGK